MLLSLLPLTRVDVLVGVGHDALALTQAVSPVTVIHTDASIDHLTDSVLLVVFPATDVLVLRGHTLLIGLGEVFVGRVLTFSDLRTTEGA